MKLVLRCKCGAFLRHDGDKYIDNLPAHIYPCVRCINNAVAYNCDMCPEGGGGCFDEILRWNDGKNTNKETEWNQHNKDISGSR